MILNLSLNHIMIALLLLGLFMYFAGVNQETFGSALGNTSQFRDAPYVTVTSYGVQGKACSESTGFATTRYEMEVDTTLFLNKQKTDTTVIPVILFKNAAYRAEYFDGTKWTETFTIKKDELSNTFKFRATILSEEKPLQRIARAGTRTFSEGDAHYTEVTPGSHMKIILQQISSTPVLDAQGNYKEACAARFYFECVENFPKISGWLSECTDEDKFSCTNDFLFCGSRIHMKANSVDCGENTADVEYGITCDVSGGTGSCPLWSIRDKGAIYFFVVDPNKPLDRHCVYQQEQYEGALEGYIDYENDCFHDLIGSEPLEFEPIQPDPSCYR